ncbi:MAG: hypothetical protein Q4G33_10005 [bacterium]|nr:hypothetical protein [bacterium]
MVDITPELIKLFRANGITLIAEEVQDSVNEYPLVTYSEAENSDNAVGDNVGYSNIAYTINVWTKSKAECMSVSKKVDEVMHSAEFMRTGSLFQTYGGLYRHIWTYRRLVYEAF